MPAAPRDAAGPLRALVEAGVLLAIGVAMFREFAAEGYMISTGSMAPTLLGFHRRAECGACGTSFAAGAAAELGLVQSALASTAAPGDRRHACPNCGLPAVMGGGPVTEGDQILVHRGAFAGRDPRRWEPIVFRSPDDADQAFVKRVVGRPGEHVCVRRGDVCINGEVARKPLTAQRAVAVLISDAALRPSDGEWSGRWQTDRGVRRDGGSFAFAASPTWQWVRYRHWRRTGGRHRTSVPIDRPPDVDTRTLTDGRVVHVATEGRLSCVGVLSASDHAALAGAAQSAETLEAIGRLEEQSHLAPVTDDAAYNSPADGPSFAVRDLMWCGRVRLAEEAAFRVRVLYGRQPFEVVLDAAGDRAVLATANPDGSAGVLEETTLPSSLREGDLVTVSVFDRQVIVAVGDRTLFAPLPFSETPLTAGRSRVPVRFAARGGVVRVDSVRLFRDVYYTPKGEAEAGRTLGADEFFVLGDNSRVSVDSRVWPVGTVRRGGLLGKPFAVHLPSRRADVPALGQVRVPDWGRVRMIR